MPANISDLDEKIRDIRNRISELKTLIKKQLELYEVEDENLKKLHEIHLKFFTAAFNDYIKRLKILANRIESLSSFEGAYDNILTLSNIQAEFGRLGINYLNGIKRAWEEYENQIRELESRISKESRELVNVNYHIEGVTNEIVEEARLVLGELSNIIEKLKIKENSSLESLKKLSEKLKEFQEKI